MVEARLLGSSSGAHENLEFCFCARPAIWRHTPGMYRAIQRWERAPDTRVCNRRQRRGLEAGGYFATDRERNRATSAGSVVGPRPSANLRRTRLRTWSWAAR